MLHEKIRNGYTNFKSIEVWNKLPADIRTSDTLNEYLLIIWRTTTSHGTEFITNVFFIFCDMSYLCVMCYQQ